MKKMQIIAFLVGIYLFLNYCFSFLSPFIFGYIFAKIIHRFKPKHRLFSIVLYSFFLIFLLLIVIFLLLQLYLFIKNIYLEFPSYTYKLHIEDAWLKEVLAYLLSMTHKIIPYMSNLLIIIPKSISFLFLTLFLTLIYLFDMHAIGRILLHLFPTIFNQIKDLQEILFQTFYSMIISSLKLFFITWIECLIGLFFLQVEHIVFYSFIIALFDPLPLFGIGIILIPTSIYLFLINHPHAIYYLLMYLIMSIIRFFIEPKIISKQLNIPFLLHFFMMLLCGKLFGFIGFLYAPFLCIFIVIWYKQKQVK